MFEGVVSWCSMRLTTVVASSTEAERRVSSAADFGVGSVGTYAGNRRARRLKRQHSMRERIAIRVIYSDNRPTSVVVAETL